MRSDVLRALLRWATARDGIVTRSEALQLGATPGEITGLVRSGRLWVVHRGVYVVTGAPPRARTMLAAACAAAGDRAVASHRSALWIWGLAATPRRPEITVPHTRMLTLAGVDIHRSRVLRDDQVTVRKRIHVTQPERTLLDAAAWVTAIELDRLVDTAMANRLTSPQALRAAMTRTAPRGRPGVTALCASLDRRGYSEVPSSSVLERQVYRLLREWGIEPLGIEVTVLGGRYRLDVLLTETLVLEIDGYAYHATAAAMQADIIRQNDLVTSGLRVLRCSWMMVMHQPEQLRRTIEAALRAFSGPLAAR